MKRLFVILLVLCSLNLSAQSLSDEVRDIMQWRAGAEVSEVAVEACGVENCFVSENISDEVFARIKGKSYKDGCTVRVEDLRYIKVLHRDAENKILLGEMVCSEVIAEELLAIFRVLYDNAYPIERMVLVDDYNAEDALSMRANNSSAFNFRYISGTKKLSNHSLGLAVDINPLYNPYVKKVGGRTIVDPKEAAEYVNRNHENPYIIKDGDLLVKEFLKHGFKWGGNWKSLKDYQHFER